MTDDGDLPRFLRKRLRAAGRRYAETRNAFRQGHDSIVGRAESASDLPRDDQDRARIVCRRYAEKRAVVLDEAGRPDCFDADHPDCQGCAEDVRDGTVETW